MSVVVEVEGDLEIERRLTQIQQRALPEVDLAMRAGAEQIAWDARRLAPVRTGLLRSRIIVRAAGAARYHVASLARYSLFVEFGTWKMKARPFLRPAYYANIGRVRMLVRRAIQDLLE